MFTEVYRIIPTSPFPCSGPLGSSAAGCSASPRLGAQQVTVRSEAYPKPPSHLGCRPPPPPPPRPPSWPAPAVRHHAGSFTTTRAIHHNQSVCCLRCQW